jgi:hypothetical protein
VPSLTVTTADALKPAEAQQISTAETMIMEMIFFITSLRDYLIYILYMRKIIKSSNIINDKASFFTATRRI